MKHLLKTTVYTASFLAIAATTPAIAQSFSDAQKKEIGSLVREYLLENPGVIFEAAEAHEQKQAAAKEVQAKEAIEENFAYLTRADAPAIGNPNADITIVEFFDYNCGYCKRALPDLQKVVEQDSNVRVVFKELPILGPTSRTAAQWALAAKQQGKYFEFHTALMEHRGPKDVGQLSKLAEGLGLDVEKMKEDAISDAVEEHLQKDIDVSRKIGVQGTPAFIVGTQFIPGYVGVDGLKDAVSKARDEAS